MSSTRHSKLAVFAGWAMLAVAAVSIFLTFRASAPESGNPVKVGRILQDGPQQTTPQARSPRGAVTDLTDPAAQIARCKAAGNFIGMQTTVRDWFAKDPLAVREWVASQKSLKYLQPALVQIANDVTDAGSPADALKWAELMESGPERDQLMFKIYATGWRYHLFSEEEIRAAPYPPERIEFLLSGAADD